MKPRLFRVRYPLMGLAVVLLVACVKSSSFADGSGAATIPLHSNTDRFGDPLPRYALARLGTIRWRHGAAVHAVAVHPDGKAIVSATSESIHIWALDTGKEVRRLRGHRGRIQAIALDQKGEKVAALVDDTPPNQAVREKIVLWDYKTGKMLWVQQANSWLCSLIFSPDGTSLATGGGLKHAYLWDVKTGERRAEFPYDKRREKYTLLGPESIISFSPDGRLLADTDGGIGHIWNAFTKKKVWTSDPKDGDFHAIVFSPDGKSFACASKKRLILRDVVSKKEIAVLPACPFSLQFSPDGKQLAVCETPDDQRDAFISIWDLSTTRCLRTIKWQYPGGIGGSYSKASILAFSAEGKLLAWAGRHRVHLVNVADGEESEGTRAPHDPLDSLAFSPKEKGLALGSSDGSVYLWDLSTIRIQKTFSDHKIKSATRLAFSPDGETLVVGTQRVHFWNLSTRKITPPERADDFQDGSFGVVFLSDGKRVISASGDEELQMWDMKTGQRRGRFRATESIRTLALSSNEELLAGGSLEGSVCVWTVQSRKEVRSFHDRRGEIRAITFSPNGKVLASAGDSNLLNIWEIASAKICLQLTCSSEVNCLAFSHDGRFLASGGKDATVSIWDLATGMRSALLTGHLGPISALAFSPDGKTLATASEDTTALLWGWQDAIPPHEQKRSPLPPRELQRSWEDLASQDAKIAQRAVWTLAAVPKQAIPLLREYFPPVAGPDATRVTRLIADLNNDSFDERNRAMRELESLGELAESQLRKAISANPSPETRRRAKEIVERLERPVQNPDKLRYLRALILLEQINTSEGIILLKRIAQGAPESTVTREAQAVVDRLEKRRKASKRKGVGTRKTIKREEQ